MHPDAQSLAELLRQPDRLVAQTIHALADHTLAGAEPAFEHLVLGDERIRKGSLVFISPWVTQRDPRFFEAPESFELTTVVKIRPQDNTALEGLYRSGPFILTQCEAEGFRRITYYLDRPDVMARFRTTIVGDGDELPIMLSNGNEVARYTGYQSVEAFRAFLGHVHPWLKPSDDEPKLKGKAASVRRLNHFIQSVQALPSVRIEPAAHRHGALYLVDE